MRPYIRKAALSGGAAAMAIICASTAWAQAKSFDVPSEDAVNSIPEFARQAGVQIVAPADQLEGLKTDALNLRGQGERSVAEHRHILEAIEDHDGDLAEMQMRRHIAAARTQLSAAALKHQDGSAG
jgi:hypothetical protein